MKQVLVCDIGGTNSRFAYFSIDANQKLLFHSELRLKTNDFDSFEAMLEELGSRDHNYHIDLYDCFVAALPGPVVSEDRLAFPNVRWAISRKKLHDLSPKTEFLFINDFVAQAYGCCTSVSESSQTIIATDVTPSSDIAIIGAGTGTGYCFLKSIAADGYISIASEAGHSVFPFINRIEFEFLEFLTNKIGIDTPVINDVLSGEGLSSLHQFITGAHLHPSEVVQQIGLESETTRWFSRFYGRCCKSFALTVLGGGGTLYISGGLAIKNPFLVDNDSFRDEFSNKKTKVDQLVNSIPVSLIRDEKIGLWGAAYYAALQ
jgi:glucokinase